MTYWARLDGDGPWLESELLVRSSAFELRPFAPAFDATRVPFDEVSLVEASDPVPDPGERTVVVHTTGGARIAVRGPAAGIASLESSLRYAEPDGPGAGSTRRSTALMAIGVVAVVALMALWTYHSNQHELAAKADERRASHGSTTTTTEPELPPARVEGATTVPTTTSPPGRSGSGPSRATSSTVPGPTVPGGSSTTVAPSVVDSVPPATTVPGIPPPAAGPTHVFTGTVTVRQAQDASAAAVCGGVKGLQDISTGAPVTVRDAAGQVVATGTLGACRFVPPDAAGIPQGGPASTAPLPQFDFAVPNVPESDRYTIEVAHYAPVDFTRSQFGSQPFWRVSLVIWL